MLRRVNVQEWQKVTQGDFNNFGLFPQHTFDRTLEDLGPGFAYAGFNVVQVSPAAVQVGPGRLYTVNGPVFFIADSPGIEIDFLGQLPVVTRRWAAITVWGQEIETQTEPRTFLTDATTRATVARVVSTETRRHVNIAPVYSQESPDPQRPPIASNVLAVAYVLLGPTGILQIIPAEENRATSLWRLLLRANDFDSWRTRIGSRLDTLASDLANLANRILGTAKLSFVLDVARDLSRVKETLQLPQDYSAWSTDHFLTSTQSATAHADWLAKVEEGCRFPHAAERLAQIALLNQYDEQVIVQNNFMLPKYEEVARINVVGNDAELSVSQYEYQVTELKQLSRTRTRIRYGATYYYCSNCTFWQDRGIGAYESLAHGAIDARVMTYDPIQNIFKRGAESFSIISAWEDYPGHIIYRLQQFWIDEVQEYYWDNVTTTLSFSGSVVSQTFLNSQDGWMTSIDLFFNRVAAQGDVHVYLTETAHGAPEFDRVYASATIPAANLRTYPNATKVPFIPVFLQQGMRYGIVIQSTGNHFLSLVTGNKYGQGMLFQSTAAQWAMGDMTRDLAFRINFAEFALPRVAVQLQPLTLDNGIAAIDLNFDSARPPVCEISFEVQVNGQWVPFIASSMDSPNPLNGLPPLLPFRVILTGTTDVMPGIGVGPNGWATTLRPRNDFRHISTWQNIPTPVDTVYVDMRLEAWRGGDFHTCDCFLLTDETPPETKISPKAVTDERDPYDPFTIVRRCTFEFDVPITKFRIRMEGWTDNVLTCFHVAERVQVSVAIGE